LGVYVILASVTHRNDSYAKELQMDSFMISYNGAVITDLKRG
jgi:hydroxymethylpyrimidine pyrophosphatase-like HAD family hydrolase